CRRDRSGRREHVAARELVLLRAAHVHGHPAAGLDALDLAVVLLQPSHPDAPAAGHDVELLPHRERSVDERPGDDGAETADREDAIDREARAARVAPALAV